MTVTAKKNVKKGNGFTRQNNNFAWASRFLLHFFAVTVHTTRTSNFLFLRFTRDVNTRRRFSFFFKLFELRYGPYEFHSRTTGQYLTIWMTWNYSDEVWNSTISLFQWPFRALPPPWWFQHDILDSILINTFLNASLKLENDSREYLPDSYSSDMRTTLFSSSSNVKRTWRSSKTEPLFISIGCDELSVTFIRIPSTLFNNKESPCTDISSLQSF